MLFSFTKLFNSTILLLFHQAFQNDLYSCFEVVVFLTNFSVCDHGYVLKALYLDGLMSAFSVYLFISLYQLLYDHHMSIVPFSLVLFLELWICLSTFSSLDCSFEDSFIILRVVFTLNLNLFHLTVTSLFTVNCGNKVC